MAISPNVVVRSRLNGLITHSSLNESDKVNGAIIHLLNESCMVNGSFRLGVSQQMPPESASDTHYCPKYNDTLSMTAGMLLQTIDCTAV